MKYLQMLFTIGAGHGYEGLLSLGSKRILWSLFSRQPFSLGGEKRTT